MLLLLLTDALADDTFQPDESEHLLSVTALQQTGAVRGRTGRLLLQSSNPEAIAALPEVAELRLLPGGLLRLTPKPGIDDLALSRRLHARADVAWVHPDFILPLQVRMMPNDPLLPQQWHLENTGQNGRTPGVDINAPLAWDYATGAGQTIAVLDSGVQADHPDLRLILGHDYIDKDEDPSPGTEWSAGHGTSCSGIAAAIGNNDYGVAGVAWDAEVYGIRLIGGSTTTEDVYDAFVEAVDQGAGVLSNSWGYSEDCTPTPDFRSFKTMFEYAETKGRGGLGSVVTFAAGNGNCDISEDGLLTHETVVVVAAVESNDIRASYSDFGTPVDISAPTTLLTTDLSVGGFGSYNGDEAMVDGFNGTSAATPVVSGVVALMLEANPRLTAAQVREVLCDTAVREDVLHAGYSEEGWSPYYGCGRVDAAAAVLAVANEAPVAPVPILQQGTAYEGRVILAWEPSLDADGDVRDYELSWSVDGQTVTQTVVGTHLDLGDQVFVGQTVTWKVRARDPWGFSDWSPENTISVIAIPEAPKPKKVQEESGCATSGGAGWWGLLGVVALWKRRPSGIRPVLPAFGFGGWRARAPER